MIQPRRGVLALSLVVVAGASGTSLGAQAPVQPVNDLPNPYQTIENHFKMPEGRAWGSTSAVDVSPDGRTIWVAERCSANRCWDDANGRWSPLDVVFKFDASGRLLTSFGQGLMAFPHGIHVDREGNVWISDTRTSESGTMGQQVTKFSPRGEVLLRLGTAGKAGNPPERFTEPNDVITAPNGDIFIAEGHGGKNPDGVTVARISKFSKDGKFIKSWGRLGSGPGEFDRPHALAFDSRGRLFVADRQNHRIQIFDQDGKYLDSFVEFSRVSGIFITPDDRLYAIDSESNPERHPNWKTGIRIGSVNEDRVTAFIPPHHSDAGPHGAAGEGVAVDPEGNVYAAEGPTSRKFAGGGLTKYEKR